MISKGLDLRVVWRGGHPPAPLGRMWRFMKIFKIISNIFYGLAIIALVTVAFSATFSVLKAPGGYRLFMVLSGSMEPKIKTGSVVLVAPKEKYKADEVITFLANPQANLRDIKATVTHRIVSVHDDEGRPTYTTKGDANEDPDREMVTHRQVLGKVIISIPFLGYVVSFAKTQTGLIALIIIPATLIIYSELLNIKKEVNRMAKKFKQKRQLKKEKIKEEEEKKRKKKRRFIVKKKRK